MYARDGPGGEFPLEHQNFPQKIWNFILINCLEIQSPPTPGQSCRDPSLRKISEFSTDLKFFLFFFSCTYNIGFITSWTSLTIYSVVIYWLFLTRETFCFFCCFHTAIRTCTQGTIFIQSMFLILKIRKLQVIVLCVSEIPDSCIYIFIYDMFLSHECDNSFDFNA